MKTDLALGLTVLVYVSLGVSGELLLSRAMKRLPPVRRNFAGALQAVRYVVTTPLAVLGTLLLAANFALLLALLSRLDVSVIVPSHAASYLLLALTARFVLHEAVSLRRWVGVLLITAGVSLVLTSRAGEPVRPRGRLRRALSAVPAASEQSATIQRLSARSPSPGFPGSRSP
jgi:drug/metabolite transporter (DMT)-like permease